MHAGAGGVGHFAVQLAKIYGFEALWIVLKAAVIGQLFSFVQCCGGAEVVSFALFDP